MMVRNILGVLAGVAVAILAVMAGEFVLHVLVPLPMPDPADAAAMEALMASAPLAAKWGLVVVYFVATALGAFTATRITVRVWSGWVVMAVMMAATVANFVMLPHPAWLMIAALVLIGAGGWLGIRTARPRPAAAG